MPAPITPEEIEDLRRAAEDPRAHGVVLSKSGLLGLLAAFDEAVRVANEYYFDIRQHVGDYQWNKHWAGDADEYAWLKKIGDTSPGAGSG